MHTSVDHQTLSMRVYQKCPERERLAIAQSIGTQCPETIGTRAIAIMKMKLLLFLIITIGFVALLIYYDQERESPWDSDVFFGATPLVGSVYG